MNKFQLDTDKCFHYCNKILLDICKQDAKDVDPAAEYVPFGHELFVPGFTAHVIPVVTCVFEGATFTAL